MDKNYTRVIRTLDTFLHETPYLIAAPNLKTWFEKNLRNLFTGFNKRPQHQSSKLESFRTLKILFADPTGVFIESILFAVLKYMLENFRVDRDLSPVNADRVLALASNLVSSAGSKETRSRRMILTDSRLVYSFGDRYDLRQVLTRDLLLVLGHHFKNCLRSYSHMYLTESNTVFMLTEHKSTKVLGIASFDPHRDTYRILETSRQKRTLQPLRFLSAHNQPMNLRDTIDPCVAYVDDLVLDVVFAPDQEPLCKKYPPQSSHPAEVLRRASKIGSLLENTEVKKAMSIVQDYVQSFLESSPTFSLSANCYHQITRVVPRMSRGSIDLACAGLGVGRSFFSRNTFHEGEVYIDEPHYPVSEFRSQKDWDRRFPSSKKTTSTPSGLLSSLLKKRTNQL